MDIVKQSNHEERIFKQELKNHLKTMQEELTHIPHLANKDLIENNIPLFVKWLNTEHISKYFMELLTYFIDYTKDMELISTKFHISEKKLSITNSLEKFLENQTISYQQI